VFLVASLALWSEPLFGSFQLEKISVECDGNTTLALIQTDGVVAFEHFELGDQVFRVVVDLPETVNPAGITEYGEFPCSSLAAIRTSQFSKKPLVARVVFDFAQQIEWGVKQEGGELRLSFSTPGEQKFTSITVFQAEAKIETKKAPEPTALPSVQKETPGTEKTSEATEVTIEKASASPPPVKEVKKGEILLQREKIETKKAPEPTALPSVQKENRGTEKTPEAAEVTIEKASASAPPVKKLKKGEVLLQREKIETKKAPEPTALPSVQKETPGTEKTSEATKVTIEKASASAPPVKKLKKGEILPQREKIETKKAPEPTALPSVQKETPGTEKTSEAAEVTIEKASASPPPVKEVKKGEILPQREEVEYTPKNPRDPFASLIGKEKPVGFVLSNLPRGENLSLVGIVDEGPHFKALCEDQFGTGYILGENDRLEDGYVASVEPDRAVLIIEQYGWSRRRLLELPSSGR
jgi:hypothetical protein